LTNGGLGLRVHFLRCCPVDEFLIPAKLMSARPSVSASVDKRAMAHAAKILSRRLAIFIITLDTFATAVDNCTKRIGRWEISM
jgi:hypothetical protein